MTIPKNEKKWSREKLGSRNLKSGQKQKTKKENTKEEIKVKTIPKQF
jgi:hypothetical protein